MRKTFYPLAGQTVLTELGFYARTVVIDCGPNQVQIPDLALTFPPGYGGGVFRLPRANDRAYAIVTAPSSALSGQASVTAGTTVLSFTDEPIPPNTGNTPPSTTQAQLVTGSFTLAAVGQVATVLFMAGFSGVRTIQFSANPDSGTLGASQHFFINAQDSSGGGGEQVFLSALAASGPFTVAFGQGTTIPLPGYAIQIGQNAGNAVTYGIRVGLFY